MKKKNVLMTALSLTLVGVIAAGSTLAYLTSQSDTLTNTFTVGEGYGTEQDPGFYLDETAAKVEVVEGKTVTTNPTSKDQFGRTKEGNTYAAMSIGDTIYKDPTFHLDEGPESYIFAKVEGVDAMEAESIGFEFTDWSENWVKIDGFGTGRDGYYYYKDAETGKDTVTAGTEIAPLFTKVSLPAALQALPDASHLTNITIKGVAIQAANLATWRDAWDALAADAPGFRPAA